MKIEIIEFLKNAAGEIAYGVRNLCGKPSPLKRFVSVLIVTGILGIAFLYTIVTSIYNIGRYDAAKEFVIPENEENYQLKNDSINLKTDERYEYTSK